jgi:hypothetical protein
MMQSASVLLRAAGKCTGKGTAASVEVLGVFPATPWAVNAGLRISSKQAAASVATRCGAQLKAGLASTTSHSAAQTAVCGQSVAATCAARLQSSAVAAVTVAARSGSAGSWAAGAAQRVRAAARPAARLLTSELRAVFQPHHALQHAHTACAAGSGAAGAAAGRVVRAHCSLNTAPPAAAPITAAAAQRVLRPPQARHVLSTSSTAAAVCAGKQPSLGFIASRKALGSAASAAQRQGPTAAGAAARQQARAYNGYSRGSYQSPWAAVTLRRGMNPMHALYGVIGVEPSKSSPHLILLHLHFKVLPTHAPF